jgi:ATP-binding cassette, subfamily B (MDR/TAP), member 1
MVGIRLSAAIRLAYIQALFTQPVYVIDTLPSGQATKTITAKANELQLGISEKLGTFLQYASVVIGSVAVSFRYSWSLTLVSGSILLFVILLQIFLLPLIHKRMTKVEDATSKAASIASNVFSSIRMIVAFGAEDRVSSRHASWVDKAREEEHGLSPLVGVQFMPVFFTVYSNIALTFWFGIRQYTHGNIANVGTIVV